MRILIAIGILLAAGGCQQNVAVPTAEELIANRHLLTEWQSKCNTGEYSQFAAAQKSSLCSTTQNATISVAETEAAKKSSDFYDANTPKR